MNSPYLKSSRYNGTNAKTPLPKINKNKKKEKKRKAHVISPPSWKKDLTMIELEKEVALS